MLKTIITKLTEMITKDENKTDEVIIVLTNNINTESKKYLKQLHRNKKLNDVRNMLLRNECDSDDDLHVGSGCRFLHFLKDKAVIKPYDESKLDLLEIIETRDGSYYLYIIQNDEFDLTQLRFEKGFVFNRDGSITSAPFQAFKINPDEIKLKKKKDHHDKIDECNHETAVKCKRPLILDAKLSAAYSGLAFASIGFSHEDSDQKDTQYTRHKCELLVKGVLTISDRNVSAKENFIEDVNKVLNDKIHDKISKLHEISEKYGHFYARRLILGGAVVKNEEYAKSSIEYSKVKSTNAQVDIGIGISDEVNAAHINDDTRNNYNNNANNIETVIGGANYSQDDENPWRKSLNNSTKWKIIGYKEAYSLFELLSEETKKKVLDVMSHQILEAKVDEITFNIREYEKNKNPLIHRLLITNKMLNMSECNILASILSEKNNVFSLHVEYIDGNKNSPVIVVHHIQGESAKWFNNQDNQIKIKLAETTGFLII
ncbi:hsp70 family protein [Gigaspora margarita]|uniref:Hsp70 family protein n=1 Tax=Gigaspora margarita TaxID=4874 RepID=A0A8H4EU35_GIGMA|nr:hsp70 family protein [Gigaspora margarita]